MDHGTLSNISSKTSIPIILLIPAIENEIDIRVSNKSYHI